uniref:Uncharacterized protein n=1 Tax=Strombidium inclinatum TaxID=197538 RepID=A0A7S3IF66_9SPIT|mmetsp:Transcript_15678/g.24036  ORF Transcript_15678/g.24036 Transcript_15678/m.24036 type:complete len:128 (+) Transcript_15678:844-1227(+)
MLQTIETMDLSVTEFDNHFTSKMFGFKDGPDYHYKGSCFHRLRGIRKPTLFMNALDDPIIGWWGIDFDSFKDNEHIVLATNEFGGHMGYVVDFFSSEQWFYKPALDYLYLFRFGPIEGLLGLAGGEK